MLERFFINLGLVICTALWLLVVISWLGFVTYKLTDKYTTGSAFSRSAFSRFCWLVILVASMILIPTITLTILGKP
jgi:hypothetical protein